MAKRKGGLQGVVQLLEEDHTETLEKTTRLQDLLTNLRYEGKVSFGKNVKEAEELLGFFQRELVEHVRVEEEIVFPFAETHVPKLESALHLLLGEHEDFRRNVGDFQFRLGGLVKEKEESRRAELIEKIRETGTYLIYLLRNHIRAENEIVYKILERELKESEKKELERRVLERSPLGGDR